MRVLVTGALGLVGSEAVRLFDGLGWDVFGVDSNLRRAFFGPEGDVAPVREELLRECRRYTHAATDLRDREELARLVESVGPSHVLHAAGQPSHDFSAKEPGFDFDVNACGTLNLLEAVRGTNPEAVFVFLSTNKVYGEHPNSMPLVELETRFDYEDPETKNGIHEKCPIDQTTHSPFGVSKTAADLMVQEYGRYFGLRTVCLRAGCITGAAQRGVELHGFLNYLCRTAKQGGAYTVFGFSGKQVRDNLHAHDLARAIAEIFANPPDPGTVYNIGGGRDNSVSILEAIALVDSLLPKALDWRYREKPRKGDHVCYITDLRKFRAAYPRWKMTRALRSIVAELVGAV